MMSSEPAFIPPADLAHRTQLGYIIDSAFPDLANNPGEPGRVPRLVLLLGQRLYGSRKIPAYTVIPAMREIEKVLREQASPDKNRMSLQNFAGATGLLENFKRTAELPVTAEFFPALFSSNAKAIFGWLSGEQMETISKQAEGHIVCNRHALQIYEIGLQRAKSQGISFAGNAPRRASKLTQ